MTLEIAFCQYGRCFYDDVSKSECPEKLNQDSNGNLAVKLLRTFAAQTEALQRYRGKGQQKVTVEHVLVHTGGHGELTIPHRKGREGRLLAPLTSDRLPRSSRG